MNKQERTVVEIALGSAEWGVGYAFGPERCGISFQPIAEGAKIGDPVRDFPVKEDVQLVVTFANLESLAVVELACAKARAVLEGKITNAELLAEYNDTCDALLETK